MIFTLCDYLYKNLIIYHIIMTKYNCEPCDFESDNKNDYNRHCNTNKHKNNTVIVPEIELFICNSCGNEYSSQSGRTKHMKKCITLANKSNDNTTNDMLKEKIKSLKKKLNEKDTTIKLLKELLLLKDKIN